MEKCNQRVLQEMIQQPTVHSYIRHFRKQSHFISSRRSFVFLIDINNCVGTLHIFGGITVWWSMNLISISCVTALKNRGWEELSIFLEEAASGTSW